MTVEEFAEVFDEEKQDEFLQQVRMGVRRGAAIDMVFEGDDPDRRRLAREYIAINGEFELKVLDAEVEATEHVEEALYQAAVSGSVSAAKTWLDLQGRGVDSQGASQKAPAAPQGPEPSVDVPGFSGGFADLDNVAALDPRRRRGT